MSCFRRLTTCSLALTVLGVGEAESVPMLRQYAHLESSDGGRDDVFGFSVAISGDTAVVGAHVHYHRRGAAYVYQRGGQGWILQAKLEASDGDPGELFGYSVAISGTTIVVGALDFSSGISGEPSGTGAAYVFVRSGAIWEEKACLRASNADRDDEFGRSVAISGNIIAVGAPEEDGDAASTAVSPNEELRNSGAAYLFEGQGSNWTQRAYLKGSNLGQGDLFGYSAAVDGDTVVIGSLFERTSEPNVRTGAAYVFDRTGGTWTERAHLEASNWRAGDWFGASVAVSGDTIAVGAPNEDGEDREPGYNAGAVYIFTRDGADWSQQAYLKASNPDYRDEFGWSVSLSENTVAIGAHFEDGDAASSASAPNNLAPGAGSAYVFARGADSIWSQLGYLKGYNAMGDAQFGGAVAISSGTVVVGAPKEGGILTPQFPNDGPGAVHVFETLLEGQQPDLTLQATPTAAILTARIPFAARYGIEYSPALERGSWVEIGDFPAPNAVGISTFVDTNPERRASPSGYYRAFDRE